jgi:fucose 4-O-acetylase-like acetyltransferase
VAGVVLIHALGSMIPRLLEPLGVVGRVPLFFYCVHIGILGVFSKRLGIYYRQGEVLASLVGLAILLALMLPLAKWFEGLKRRSTNPLIRLI